MRIDKYGNSFGMLKRNFWIFSFKSLLDEKQIHEFNFLLIVECIWDLIEEENKEFWTRKSHKIANERMISDFFLFQICCGLNEKQI